MSIWLISCIDFPGKLFFVFSFTMSLLNNYDLELKSIIKNSKNYLIKQGYLDLKKDSEIKVIFFENEKEVFF